MATWFAKVKFFSSFCHQACPRMSSSVLSVLPLLPRTPTVSGGGAGVVMMQIRSNMQDSLDQVLSRCDNNHMIIVIIMYIYHAPINAMSAHMIHTNLNMIFYTHVEYSPTKTIYIKYYTEKQTNTRTTHTRTHTHLSLIHI